MVLAAQFGAPIHNSQWPLKKPKAAWSGSLGRGETAAEAVSMANHSTIHARLVPPKSKTTGKRNVSSGNQLIDLGHDGLFRVVSKGESIPIRLIRFEGINPDFWVIPAGPTLAGDVIRVLAELEGGASE